VAGTTPLATVVTALERAAERGEIDANELEWSLARLSGRVRAGNPRTEGVDRRDAILRTAIEIFRRDSYNRTTLETIANELFMTKAGIYHYFASKNEIIDAICERSSAATHDAVMTAREGRGNAAARLERMVEAYAEACMTEPGFAVLMRNLNEVSPAVLAGVQGRTKAIAGAFRETLEQGMRRRAFAKADAGVTAFGILGTINWLYAWFRPDGRLPADEVRATLVAFVLRGVAAVATD